MPHVIPDDTDIMPPDNQPYDGNTIKVPLVQIKNTRSRRLKGHNLMAKHVTTTVPLRQILTHQPTMKTVLQTGEDRVLKKYDHRQGHHTESANECCHLPRYRQSPGIQTPYEGARKPKMVQYHVQ